MNDDDGDAPIPRRRPAGGSFGSRLADDLVMGLRFYSRLPLIPGPDERPELNRIALALPFTSLVIGLPPVLVLLALVLLGLPGIFAAGLATLVLLIVTGALAEDGLADACDGLFGGTTATRRLEIMRDSRHGTYGIAALVLLLVLRIVAVGAIAAASPLGAAGAWLAAQILARSGSLWLAVSLPPARADGLSASVGGVTRNAFAVGAVFAAILALAFSGALAGPGGLVAVAGVTVAVIWGWQTLCKRLVGGQTGDLIGALQAAIELAALTVFLAFA